MRLGLLTLLLCAALHAQEYSVDPVLGIGGASKKPGLVAGPFTPLAVNIQRSDTRPFHGRVVVSVTTGRSRRGPFVSEGRGVELVQEVSLEEGVQGGALIFELPVFGNMINGNVALERQSGDGFEPVATDMFSSSARDESEKLVGFISAARIEDQQAWLWQEMIEISPGQAPESWKLLACFDAIVLNDDRLTRRQADALVDYVVAGGCLVISPNSAAAFNPELPLARLIGANSAAQTTAKVGDFQALRAELKPSGLDAPRTTRGPVYQAPGTTAKTEESPPVPKLPQREAPVAPDANDALVLWKAAGRARPVDSLAGLVSRGRFGAGSVYMVHADLSQAPLAASNTRAPTAAGLNLLNGALAPAMQDGGKFPTSRLSMAETRDVLDIAGKRIPSRDLQLLMIFLYVGAAGVGVFLLARRIRRPELYPAVLLGLAAASVLLAFGVGELAKRAGDRVKAVRLVVSDGVGGRNGVYSFGCAYVTGDEPVRFSLDHSPWLVPAQPASYRRGGIATTRGLPDDYGEYAVGMTPTESITSIKGLDRWQNLYFAAAEPAAIAGLQMRLANDGGAYTLENRSPHNLAGCLVLVGGPAAPSPGPGYVSCEWHYIDALGVGGGGDARAPLSQGTRAPANCNVLGQSFRDAAKDSELAAAALCALLGLSQDPADLYARSQADLEHVLEGLGLLPGEGEYLVIAILPDDAASKGSLGLRGVDPERVSQGVIWATRGFVEAR